MQGILVRLSRAAKGPGRLVRRRDAGEARLWPFGAALSVGFVAAALGLAGLGWLAWVFLHRPRLSQPGTISLHDVVGVLQLVFASVAGVGALVALIVAYRRQKIAEADSAHDRTRVFNERFTAIAAQLGDAQPAVRLAGVHAMAGLADDWQDHRQTCIDVLCAYLRMPYEDAPGGDDPVEKRLAYQASREVRHTVIRVITAHLNGTAPVSWRGLDFDFTGAVLDGGDFTGIELFSGRISFRHAEFAGGTVSFDYAIFAGGFADFRGAKFSGGTVSFEDAKFWDGVVNFYGAEFSGAEVSFPGAEFSGTTVYFDSVKFSGGTVEFSSVKFSAGEIDFNLAEFSGATIYFYCAEFSGATVTFFGPTFSAGTVDFQNAEFSGARVTFAEATFSGATIDFSAVTGWSHPPNFAPNFDVSGPPHGVKLPAAAGSSPDTPAAGLTAS